MYEHDDDEHDLDHEAPRSLGAADGAVRAAPRRARRDQSDAPVFLVKTYQMVDTCVPHIASWSEHGDTFIVKARSMRPARLFRRAPATQTFCLTRQTVL
jgi:hypothetical protein